MDKEKVAIFVDYAYLNRDVRGKGYHFDYQNVLDYMGEGRMLSDAYGYVFINPRSEHRLDRDIEELWRAGYMVQTKMGSINGGLYHCNFEVEITMDVLRVVQQVKPDIIVLVTDDTDFVPLIQEVRKAGVRVEVAGFEESVDEELVLKCSGFIDLGVYYESYLAAQKTEPSEEHLEKAYQDLIQSQENDLQEVLEEEAAVIREQEQETLLEGHEDDEMSVPPYDDVEDRSDESHKSDALKVAVFEQEGEESHGDY